MRGRNKSRASQKQDQPAVDRIFVRMRQTPPDEREGGGGKRKVKLALRRLAGGGGGAGAIHREKIQ